MFPYRPTARLFPAIRPADPILIGDPNSGPHTVQVWNNAAASQRLNPVYAGRVVGFASLLVCTFRVFLKLLAAEFN